MQRKPVAGATNFSRRTWDKEEFEKKAKERLEKDLSGESLKEGANKETVVSAPRSLLLMIFISLL